MLTYIVQRNCFHHVRANFQFDRVCRMFCEDPTTTQSDEFFGIFDHFITTFSDARMDNENAKKKKEEEERIAKQHQEVKYSPIQFKSKAAKVEIWEFKF